MKINIIKCTITLLFIFFTFSPSASAESKTEKYLGKSVSCLRTGNIYGTYVLDDQTILFETVHDVVYINRLPSPCHGLKVSDGFSYRAAGDKLCKQDIIRLIESSYGLTSSCGLGEFVELTNAKNISEAAKTLKDDGLLETLVKEGAFKN